MYSSDWLLIVYITEKKLWLSIVDWIICGMSDQFYHNQSAMLQQFNILEILAPGVFHFKLNLKKKKKKKKKKSSLTHFK